MIHLGCEDQGCREAVWHACTEGGFGQRVYHYAQDMQSSVVELSLEVSGVSRGVLRVLQHPPEAQRPIYSHD